MAIQPIDLQTFYSQLGNVSKTVAFQQQGIPLQNAIQQEEQTKRLQQKREAVEAASGYDEGPAGVKDDKESAADAQEQKDKKKRGENEAEEEGKIFEVIKDPRLGQHIDISG